MSDLLEETNENPKCEILHIQASPNIHQRIHAIMTDVSFVAKGEKKVDNKYNYVSHDEVTKIIHAAAVKHKITIIPSVKEKSVEQFNGLKYDTYAKKDKEFTVYLAKITLMVAFVNIDNPLDHVASEWFSYAIDTQDKATGKAYSYAYKYALLKTFALETGEDVDNDQNNTFVKGNLQGMQPLDDVTRAEANEMFFEQTKQKLMEFETLESLKKFWEKNWSHICKLSPAETTELVNIKNNVKLKIEGKL